MKNSSHKSEWEKDYIVVKTHAEARDLVMNYKGKTLRRKWVIVAPDGLKFVSKEDLLTLLAIKELLSSQRQRVVEAVEGMYRLGGVTTVWHKTSGADGGYNQALDDVLEKLKNL